MGQVLRAALYIRVSTEDQAEYSPAAQKKILMEYANKNNIEVIPQYIFADEGFSGRSADKRPAFMQMIGIAKTKPKPFDAILVHKFDRFARNRQDSIVYKSMLQKEHGIRVISVAETIEDSSMSVILEAMLEAMAEYYSINLSKEVKKGMTEKAGRGGWQTSPPLGYRMGDNNALLVSEQEARHIRYIFTQYVYHGRSPFQIAKQLNRMGVKSKRGNKMDSRGVEYILNNPVYIGIVRWTPTEKARRNFEHPDTIRARGVHEPIISEELFRSAAEKLSRRKPKARPPAECRHWLSGLVKCSNCGSTLVFSSSLKSPSFQCGGYFHGVCDVSHSITARKLEQAVLYELNRILDDNTKFQPIIHTDTGEADRLQDELSEIDTRLQRAKEAYLAQIDTLEEYRLIREESDRKRQGLENEMQKLAETHPPADAVKEIPRKASDLLTPGCDISVKQNMIRSVVEKIIYDKPNKRLEIYYCDM